MSITYHYDKFPPKNIKLAELQNLVSQARTELGRYDGLLTAIDNAEVLLSPLSRQEAVLSSRIEGTQSSLSDVLEFEADETSKKFSPKQKEEIEEIINYRNAILAATELMQKYPLSQRILLHSHKILLQGVRGKNKDPGSYRKIPNWIGTQGQEKENARFVPIEANKIPDAISLWERYIHQDNSEDDLIKCAILHAELEAIHPFLDGNGRVGRMFIPLFLWDKKLIQEPYFYISAYFERNRQAYYDFLLEVSKSNNWTAWCAFFLQGVIEEAKYNYTKAKKIIDFYSQLKAKIPQLTRSQYGIVALDYIFNHSLFKGTSFYRNSGIPSSTAQRLLKVFVEDGILSRIAGRGRTPNFYIFSELLNIAEGKDIF